MFTTAHEAHVLNDPARDRVEAFEAKAHAMLAPLLRSADASPGMRSVAQSLLGAQLQSKDKIDKLTTALDIYATICEQLERRVRDLEGTRRG